MTDWVNINMKENLEKTKLSLLTILCNATQIYRGTIPSNKKLAYQQNLKRTIKKLIQKVDSNSITNSEIRQAIKELAEASKVSIGAAQKAINVYLKFYCAVSNKNENILRELDCPIDSKVQKENSFKKISLKSMVFDDYIEMQNRLKEKYGIKILADIKAYDISKIY